MLDAAVEWDGLIFQEKKLSVKWEDEKYDKKFKKEAVKKYLDGQSVAPISREIRVNKRKRIIEMEMENEILKKAAVIFSRSG